MKYQKIDSKIQINAQKTKDTQSCIFQNVLNK